ncbi:MAG: hypothetical protein ACK47B_03280 [Armatimonadota bacterium]
MRDSGCPFREVSLKPLFGGLLALLLVLVCTGLGAFGTGAAVLTLLLVSPPGDPAWNGVLLDCAVWGGAGLGVVIGCLWARAILRSR